MSVQWSKSTQLFYERFIGNHRVSVVESDVIRSLTLALAGRPSLCGRPEQPPQSGTKELGRTEAAAGGAGDPVRNR